MTQDRTHGLFVVVVLVLVMSVSIFPALAQQQGNDSRCTKRLPGTDITMEIETDCDDGVPEPPNAGFDIWKQTEGGKGSNWVNRVGYERPEDPSYPYSMNERVPGKESYEWTVHSKPEVEHRFPSVVSKVRKMESVRLDPNYGTQVSITFTGKEYSLNTAQWLTVRVRRWDSGVDAYKPRKPDPRYIGRCNYFFASNNYAWHVKNRYNDKQSIIDKVAWVSSEGKWAGIPGGIDRVVTMYDVKKGTLEIWTFDGRGDIEGYSKLNQAPKSYADLTKAIEKTSCEDTQVTGQARDPNHITGQPSQKFIGPNQDLEFLVEFENVENATAPAYNVSVTVPLDEHLNASSISLGTTSHPRTVATKAVSDGNVTWSFKGIDLPPNDEPPEGQGWTTFSVTPDSDVQTGTEITVQGAIVFNKNPAIETNEITYVVDSTAPNSTLDASRVDPGNATTPYEVTVESEDNQNGAGVSHTLVFVSEGNGSYEQYTTLDANESTFTFDPANQSEYSFTSVAVDEVGNREAFQEDKLNVRPGGGQVGTAAGTVSGQLMLGLASAVVVLLIVVFILRRDPSQ